MNFRVQAMSLIPVLIIFRFWFETWIFVSPVHMMNIMSWFLIIFGAQAPVMFIFYGTNCSNFYILIVGFAPLSANVALQI